MKRELLFMVVPPYGVKPENGKLAYRVYTDGSIEGFPANSLVVNYYPTLLQREIAQGAATPGRHKADEGPK